jgi:hypothetical protein
MSSMMMGPPLRRKCKLVLLVENVEREEDEDDQRPRKAEKEKDEQRQAKSEKTNPLDLHFPRTLQVVP